MPELCRSRGIVAVKLWQARPVDFPLVLWLVGKMTGNTSYPVDQDLLDAEYSPSRLVDNLQSYLDAYTSRSAALPVATMKDAKLGLKYGGDPRQCLDYFPAKTGKKSPLVVFIHGGFWSALDGSQFRFPAPCFNDAGVNYATLTYRLAPDAAIGDIVSDVRTAIRWLFDNAAALGFDPEQITLVGHSAGAHLAAMVMADPNAPQLSGALFIGGVFDLEPVQKSYVNDNALMSLDDAKALSPVSHAPKMTCPSHLYVGDNETSEFKRQSELMFDAWRPECCGSTFQIVGQRNHFDILFDLAEPGSRLFVRALECAYGDKRTISEETAVALDAADTLAPEKDRFQMPEGIIYLDGNSLGALPQAASSRVAELVEKEWGDGLVRSWGEADWFAKPLALGDRIGKLIGAAKGQTAVADSISVNLFKLVCAALGMQAGRRTLITEESNFPSDIYVLQGIERFWPGVSLKLIGRDGSLENLLDEDVAAVVITGVDFKTGAMHDMRAMTKVVQSAGALMIWDLAHSAGALPVDLDGIGADMAVGCTYKYLNAGPGAPAFLYVAQRHHGMAENPISGWFGHKDPFAFSTDYEPASDIRQFLAGTPPIVSLAALESSLDIWEGVDMAAVRAKSMAMGDLFIELVEALNPDYGFKLASPRRADQRGSQVSFSHPNGLAIMRALIKRGVIGDFRAPDILRFGFTPLTLSFTELWQAVQILDDIMQNEAWRDVDGARGAEVT